MPITVTRLSDGEKRTFEDIGPNSFVKNLKSEIKKSFLPVIMNKMNK